MNPIPRTAVLAPGFQETKLVRVFAAGWNNAAARFEPASIAGPVEEIRKAAQQGIPLTHAVVVFTYEGQSCLSDDDRDLFWEAFGVPVFEQHLGRNNEVLAMECDAHAGLHLVGNFSQLRRDKNTCVCGNPAPKLARRPHLEELTELLG